MQKEDNCWVSLGLLVDVLFEVKRKDNHATSSAIDRLCVLHQRIIDEVAAVFTDDVEQAKTELQLGIQFEERQIDVATHAHFKIEVERFQAQSIVFACGEIHHGIDTTNEIRTEVVVSWCSKLQVERHGYVGAFEDLCAVCPTLLLVIDGMLLAKMDGGRKAKRQVFVQAKRAQNAYCEAGTVVVYLCVPLLARCRVYETIVLQFDVLHVNAKQKAIVQPALVNVRAVLHLALLGKYAKSERQEKE